MNPPRQTEFDFNAPGAGGGLEAWRAQQQAALETLAARLGLPLGRRVEVRLADGVILTGTLRLHKDTLFPGSEDPSNVELAVGRVNFRHSEIEACVCLD